MRGRQLWRLFTSAGCYVETVDTSECARPVLDGGHGDHGDDVGRAREGGTGSATVTPPPGLLGKANIVAFYGGDAHYLASWSKSALAGFLVDVPAAAPAAVTRSGRTSCAR